MCAHAEKHIVCWLVIPRGRRELCYSKARLSHQNGGTPERKNAILLSPLRTTGSGERKFRERWKEKRETERPLMKRNGKGK